MPSAANNPYLPNWPSSRSGFCNLTEMIALAVALGCLGNLVTKPFYRPDREYVFTYFIFSAVHLGYLTFFVFASILGDVAPKYNVDYYRNYRPFTLILDLATHSGSWYVFSQLTDNYGCTSAIYASYFLRLFLTIFIWYTRTARQKVHYD